MKKIITCLGLVAMSYGATAQSIQIYMPDSDELVSGTVVDISSGSGSLHQEFDVKNVSGATLNLRIERVKVEELTGTEDYLCWGADPITGACYSAGLVSPQNPFVTPDASDLPADSVGWLATYHVANEIAGCAQYRYYIIDETGDALDSVDVKYCSTVSIDEVEKAEVSVFPNPASANVTINLNANVNNIGFKLYNVLGDEVLTANLNSGVNSINVSRLPNGVYFYSILQEGDILETKKLIVRH